MNLLFKACLLSLALPIAASAVMRLDTEYVDVKPKPEDEEATVTFAFKNEGDKPVRILNLESACSCLSATLDRAVYEPGTTGTGNAKFKVSTFVGKQEKTITVTTDDPKQPEWVIPFVMFVPAIIDIEPKMVQWWIGDAATAKDITVKMTGPDPMKITKITSTRENVEFKLKEVKAGREYTVSVTPKKTDDVMIGALKLETDSKIPKYQRQLAFFGVNRKPAGKIIEPAPKTADSTPKEEIKVVDGRKPGSPNAAPPPAEVVKKPEPVEKK